MHIRTHISRLVGCVLLMTSMVGCGVNDTTAQTGAASTLVPAPTTLQPTAINASIEPRATTTPQPPKVTPTLRPGIAKATRLALNAQQTAQVPYSHPTRVPRPTLDPAVWGTPVPRGYIPEKERAVLAVEKKDVGAIHPLREATSIWKNGVVRSANLADWYPLYIYAMVGKDNYPIIAPLILNATQELEYTFPKLWECPRPIGAITITAITEEPLGIVSFTSKSGTGGTLNMATGEWTFSS